MSRIQQIGLRLRQAREGAGLTQAELGDALGIGANAVSKIETGRAALTLEHLFKLPDILGVSENWILGNETSKLNSDEKAILMAFRILPPGSDARRFAYHAVWSLGVVLRQNREEKNQQADKTNPRPD